MHEPFTESRFPAYCCTQAGQGGMLASMESTVPTHVGFIMDGNGRWAKKRGLPRAAGHIEGLKSLKRVIVSCRDHHISFITLYVFSTENWKRSQQEVGYLMHLLACKLPGEINFFTQEHVRIRVRGDVAGLPEAVRKAIGETEEATKAETGITCCLAINYGGQDEIVRAANKAIASGRRSLSAEDIQGNLDLCDVPPVDMIVRSAGEHRLSNFLLWDSAYAELASYEKLWPDWGEREVEQLCEDYRGRTRKFGGLKG